MEDWALTELQATCSNLGVNDGNTYHPDPDCVECVKDLIRFMRRDDANHEVRRALGDLGVVKSDLVLILRDHSNHRELFDVTLRLLVNLTSPELLLFKEELPEDKETRNFYLQIQNHRHTYKEAFVDEQLWSTLTKTLGTLLKKDWDERLEDDKLIIERILILVRNVLQVPTNVRREGRTSDDASVHDQVLWVLHQSGMQDLLLYIASSDSEANYCLHVLEIISLMFREQDPMSLASANLGRSVTEKKADEEALAKAVMLEEEKKKAKIKKMVTSRHSRFGGTFVVKNVKSITENDMIIQKPLSDMQDLVLDKGKRGVKRAKNKIAPENQDTVRRSTLPVRIFLKEFCIEFLLSAYNQLMGVVRDALNRQRAQQNDETYYLWAIRFFMQFNRGHEFRLELVSETLSRQTFHFLQQQMDAYRDNFEHEKKNRPKYLMWSRRMHLCIRAYMELLHNLVDMEGSKNSDIKEAGRILKSSVFYEPEYRELCLQQLSLFNPDRMSIGFLTDLVATTHIFLKLMEHMSKNKHLIVSKKGTKKVKKNKKKGEVASSNVGEREKNEDRWEAISNELSSILQGRGTELPSDVVPFDAASDVPMEEQKVTCMKNIQRALKEKEPALAVALMRAAREVWPEGDSFGEKDAEAEDEFMALREVLFADLGEDHTESRGDDEVGEVGEEGEDDEEEEEERVYSVEQEFDFKAFVFRFAVKNVVMPFGILFGNYAKNTKETNHHIIKMFHRIAVDCGLPAILFQASIFRVFQLIWKDLKANPTDTSLRELAKFAKFLLAKFMTVASSNKKVFMELLFWKTSREATEIFEGYGTQSSTAKTKKSFWSTEDEDKLSAVFGQVMELERAGEKRDNEGDILDQIELMFSCENKSRRQIGNKLRELGLIKNMGEITKKPLTSSRQWQEDEIEKLKELFEEYKDAENPGARIQEQWKALNMPVRSKKKLCDKIVELELVDDRSKLGKTKKRTRKPKEGEAGYLNSKSDSDSAMNSSSSEEDASSEDEASANQVDDTSSKGLDLGDALRQLNGLETSTLTWLAETLEEESKDREEEFDGEDVPLVAVAEIHQVALAKKEMSIVLSSLGLCAPSQGEQFWRIPGDMSVDQLKARANVLAAVGRGDGVANALLGVDNSLLVVIRGLGAVVENRKVEKKKKKKRGPNKWMPFRRPEGSAPKASPSTGKNKAKKTASKTSPSPRGKNKSFLDSSDEEEVDKNNDNPKEISSEPITEMNNENLDPENKENVPEKKIIPKSNKKSSIDKDRLRRLLNDDSDVGSEDSDMETKKAKDSDTSDEGVEDPLPEMEGNVKKNKKTTTSKKRAPRKTRGKKVKDAEADNESGSDDEENATKKSSKSSKRVSGKKSTTNKKSMTNNKLELKKISTEKKKSNVSSSDEGVDDPTQATDKPIAAAPSDDEEFTQLSKASKKKQSKIVDSNEDFSPIKKTKNKKLSLDSSSDEGVNDPTQPSDKAIAAASSDDEPTTLNSNTVATTNDDPNISRLDRSRSRSSSFDSRRSLSPLEDSRLSRRSLYDSRIDDSRRSISPLEDSRLRSPVSSPLSSRRSISRSLSPLSPTPNRSYSLAETPVSLKDKTSSQNSRRGSLTPSVKRTRSTPTGKENSAKKVKSNTEESMKLQLSETLNPAVSPASVTKLQPIRESDEDDSPVKKTKKKKPIVDSDSD